VSDALLQAVVVPSAPGSPHFEPFVRSLATEGETRLFVVSEEASGAGRRIQAEPGDGFARRANLGIAAARAEGFDRIFLFNDDAEVLPGCLEELSRTLDGTRIGIAGAQLLNWSEDTVQQAGIRVDTRTGRIHEIARRPSDRWERVDAVGGAAMAIDGRCWEQLGGFDERFTFYFEDIDFCLRAKQAGWGVVLCPRARVRHRGGGTRSRRSPEAAWHLGRSHALFVRGLAGGRLSRTVRLLWSGTFGLGWSARTGGLAGMTSFAQGWNRGLRA